MAVQVYRSSDQGAPVLDGTAGSLIGVLSACLVDGYGTKQPAGWSKPYSGSDVAVFRQGQWNGAISRPQYYLRVLDDGSLTAGGREAAVRAYEEMTDTSDGGTNPFPTPSQMAAGLCVRKSHFADTSARKWIVAADHRTFVLLVYHASGFNTSNGSRGDGWTGMYFGDYVPVNPNYEYPVVLIAKRVFNSTERESFNTCAHNQSAFDSYDADGIHYLARNYAGAAISQQASKLPSDFSVVVQSVSSYADDRCGQPGRREKSSHLPILRDVNPADGRIWVARYMLLQIGTLALVGWLRGLWAPCHDWDRLSDGTTVLGAGNASGRVLEYLQPTRWRDGGLNVSSTWYGGIYLETSDTWDS